MPRAALPRIHVLQPEAIGLDCSEMRIPIGVYSRFFNTHVVYGTLWEISRGHMCERSLARHWWCWRGSLRAMSDSCWLGGSGGGA